MPTDPETTLQTLKQLMQNFVKERDWEKYHTPKNLAASVSVEAAELLELFQWLTPDEAIHRPHNDLDFRRAVGEEMADVLMYIISLANALNLDLADTIFAKMAKNHAKYPPEKFRGHYQRPLK
ncbi:MAG: nucleotide pyrophosphohydrolase [Phycisphaerae bacterium]